MTEEPLRRPAVALETTRLVVVSRQRLFCDCLGLLQRLGVRDRTEAVVHAYRRRWLP